MNHTSCRMCSNPDMEPVLSLGSTPLANALRAHPTVTLDTYPIDLVLCKDCSLVQLGFAVPKEELFSNYNYVTPDSMSLSLHYQAVIGSLRSLGFDKPKDVVEIGSNIGTFLSKFPSSMFRLGIEPAKNIAEKAIVQTLCAFFDTSSAGAAVTAAGGHIDLLIARHCFAHIDDLHSVMMGARAILRTGGMFLIENAYVVDTMEGVQFDQIYHEHMSYLGVIPTKRFLEKHGFTLVRVERRPIHGGSVLFYAVKGSAAADDSVEAAVVREQALFASGMVNRFVLRTGRVITELSAMLETLSSSGAVIDLYGASAKSCILLAACAKPGQIRSAVDGSPEKHGKWLPGFDVRILSKEQWREDLLPDYILLGAWNFQDDIREEEKLYFAHGGKAIVPFPTPTVLT